MNIHCMLYLLKKEMPKEAKDGVGEESVLGTEDRNMFRF